MRLQATSILLRYPLILLALLCAPALAHAQPADDPGLGDTPPPPAAKPPATTTAPPATTTAPPPATTTAPAKPPAATTVAPSVKFVAAPIPSTPPPPEVQETTDEKVTWVEGANEKNNAAPTWDLYDMTAAPTLNGPVGLFRTLTGDSGKQGNFRIGLHIGGFTQDSFLVAGNGSLKGDTNSRFNGDLTIGYTPWKYIEAYLGIFNSSNKNTRTDTGRTDPEVILSLGDVALGLKGRYPVARFIDLALHAGVRFLNSVSGISFDGNSTNFHIDSIASLDLRHLQATAKVPLRFHFNFGFLLDNSIKLLPAGQCAKSTGNDACIRSRVVETFAYGIGSSRLQFSLAADAPVQVKSVGIQPFIEYHGDVSVGDGDQVVLNALKGSVQGTRLTGNSQQWMTIGIRVRPVAGLILDGGVDIGLQSPGFQYGPPVPEWNLVFGAAYAYDPSSRQAKTKVVTRNIMRQLERGPVVGKVRGMVRDAVTKKAIPNAFVRYLNRRDNAQSTADDGTFVSYGFQPSTISIEVSRDDYNAARVDVQVAGGAETPIEVLLTPKPPAAGTVRGHVTDEANAPINATARFTPLAGGASIDAEAEGVGAFGAKLPGGEYTMDAMAEGYLAKQKLVVVTAGQVQSVDLMLRKKPTASHVQLTKNEIVIKGTVHFGTNNAEIKPDGEQLLDEVVDVLVKNPQIRKVRVEGHTDNRGAPEKNMALSKARAAAVMAYLVKQGIDPARLESEGYGATQPLVPNLTPANRARNRRVTLRILEQGAAINPLE